MSTDSKKLLLCCLYDSVSDTFGSPTTFINENVAKRGFSDLIANEPYKKNKNDYSLVVVGDFDYNVGVISSSEHRTLIRGVELA